MPSLKVVLHPTIKDKASESVRFQKRSIYQFQNALAKLFRSSSFETLTILSFFQSADHKSVMVVTLNVFFNSHSHRSNIALKFACTYSVSQGLDYPIPNSTILLFKKILVVRPRRAIATLGSQIIGDSLSYNLVNVQFS